MHASFFKRPSRMLDVEAWGPPHPLLQREVLTATGSAPYCSRLMEVRWSVAVVMSPFV